MIRRRLQELPGDMHGVTAVEFALVAPVFLLLMLGFFHLGHMVYGQSILNGALQEAARSSTLEGADTDVADALVEDQISKVLPGAQIVSSRLSYLDFVDIGRPEQWNDANDNGTCDSGEGYVDENGSGNWDADVGVAGNGGAGDVIIYSVAVEYEPLFPVLFASSGWSTITLRSSTARKNQPFAEQVESGIGAGTCA